MSKKEKRISINALENVAKENFQDVVTEQWFDIEVTIKRNLSMTEMMQFVQDVVNMCLPQMEHIFQRLWILLSRAVSSPTMQTSPYLTIWKSSIG